MKPYEKSLSPQEYLMHYGVKGMKWGIRRYQNEDGTLTKAGKERYNSSKDNSAKEEAPQKKELSDKQKKVLKVGAAAVGAFLLAYGTYKLADSGELHRLVEKGKALVHGTKPTWKTDPDLASSNFTKDEIFSKVVAMRINPNHGDLGTFNNCRRCTFAYELSRRGFDVQATRSISGTGQTQFGVWNATHDNPLRFGVLERVHRFFTDSEFEKFTSAMTKNRGVGTPINLGKTTGAERAAKIFQELAKQPDGARGELSMRWVAGNGHSMAWEIVRGKPVIFDCQTNTMYDSIKSLVSKVDNIESPTFLRLDNAELNMNFLMRWVKNK